MFEKFQSASIGVALLVIGAGGLAASATARESAPPFSCSIHSTETRTGVHVEGQLTAADPITGTYSFKIRSKRTEMTLSLQQAGEFEAVPDAPATLGSATLPGNARDYDADLRIDWNGRTYACGVREREV